MRINYINIRGFGKLIDRTYKFPQNRVSLVIEDNESGKSTLAAAMLAMVCGFPKRRRIGEIMKLSEVYDPWNSDIYAIEMGIEVNRQSLIIERDFRKSSFTIRDATTNKDVSAKYNPDLAFHFFGLPRDDFQRIAFISGKEVHQFGSSPDIQSRLSAMVDGSEDNSSSANAIAALENTKYSLDGKQIKIDTAIKRLLADCEEKKRIMKQLNEALDAAGEDARNLEEARAHYKELISSVEQLDNEYKSARLREIREQIKAGEAGLEEISTLEAEHANLTSCAGFPIEKSSQLSKAITRLNERQSELSRLQNKAGELQKQAAAIETQLQSVQHFAAANDEDLINLGTCEREIKNANEAYRQKNEEIELEKRALKAENIDIDSIYDIRSRFNQISETDKDFLRSFSENKIQLSSQRDQTEASSIQCLTALQLIKQKRSSSRRIGIGLFGIGITVGIVSVVLMILRVMELPISVGSTVIGAVIAAIGLVQSRLSGAISADEKARLETEYDKACVYRDSIISNLNDNELHLEKLNDKLGFSNKSEIIDSFREFNRLAGRSDSLSSLHSQLMQLEESLTSTKERAVRYMSRLGLPNVPNDDINHAIHRTQEALSKYLANQKTLESIERELSTLEQDVNNRMRGVKEEETIVQSILSEAGIDTVQPLEDAIRDFENAEVHYRRYAQIKDTLLPAAQNHQLPAEALEKLKTEENTLLEQLEDSAPLETDRLSSEVETEREIIRGKLDETSNKIRTLEKSVGTCVDVYRRDYPILQNDLNCITKELERVSRFDRSLKIASNVLREVSETSHRRWASALNEQASTILPHLNPDYDSLRFDDSLDFTIRHITDGRIIEKSEVDACLSTGAKDQVYLAVKLAFSKELSQDGESIPVILDDPFMAADDTRFDRSLKYIAETFAGDQQVIILSCHKARHERLQEKDWFKSYVSVI